MSFPSPPCTSGPVPTFLAPYSSTATGREISRRRRALLPTSSSSSSSSGKAPQLVTFLGKGGSGKTTASVFAAQDHESIKECLGLSRVFFDDQPHYAMVGLKTCLVIQTQDPFADYLLNCKIGSSPTACNDNLSAVRLETTKLLLGPLDRLKLADARLKMTQGVLEGVVGEELAVLPAMDSILGAFALEQRVGLLRNVTQNENRDTFDVVVYDGTSTDETLRLLGAASKTRLYLKYLRNLAEKTDLGRLVAPSILGLVDEAMNLSSNKSSYMSGRTSSELWDILEKMLEQGSSAFSDPRKFGCLLTVDPTSSASVNSALRYWGCTVQAGSQISGAVGYRAPHSSAKSEEVRSKFEPLPFSYIPHLEMAHPVDWKSIMLDITSQDARSFFSSLATSTNDDDKSPVKFDLVNKMITLFMPGFDKSEIKLYQYRGGSELLVEAGDQRRVIRLPPKIQGKVGGAKFIDRSLIITMR